MVAPGQSQWSYGFAQPNDMISRMSPVNDASPMAPASAYGGNANTASSIAQRMAAVDFDIEARAATVSSPHSRGTTSTNHQDPRLAQIYRQELSDRRAAWQANQGKSLYVYGISPSYTDRRFSHNIFSNSSRRRLSIESGFTSKFRTTISRLDNEASHARPPLSA